MLDRYYAICYGQVKVQKGASVSKEVALFNQFSVAYIWPTIC